MKAVKLVATGILAMTVLGGIASGQQQQREQQIQDLPPGRVYIFHSSPGSGCPGVDWHVVVQANNVLAGVLAWNDMQSLARVNGSLDRGTGAFAMTAQEVGGQGRTAKISGKVNPGTGFLTADVEGPNVSCRNIEVPWFSPQQKG